MILSAICVIAFAGNSFASNEVNEQVEKFEATNSSTPCADQWSTDMAVLQGNYPGSQMNLTFDEALLVADKLFNDCLDKTYGKTDSTSIQSVGIGKLN